jgi:hypothetical protein
LTQIYEYFVFPWDKVYIKSCSHEVAKHKSGVIPIPSDGTTFSHNIKEDGNAIRTNGERPQHFVFKVWGQMLSHWYLRRIFSG